METFIPVERARARTLSELESVGTERVFLSDARGRRIAEPVRAPEDSPRFDNSSRDGFAVRWSDLDDGGTTLELVDRAVAGDTASGELGTGEAARIATGAEIPDGADTVVMQEHCTVEGDTVCIDAPPTPGRGAWIREAGSHMERGESLLEPGMRVGAAEVGVLASFRDTRLEIYRRPTVAVVSTGDELVDVDDSPGTGEIVNSNAHLLRALIDRAGGDPIVLPVAPDEPGPTRSRFENAVRTADLVVSSGGVSVGDRDEVRSVVDDLTGGMNFWKVRMKPGKPLAFGTTRSHNGVPIIGLPGNPNSCFVGFYQFVMPAIQVMQGRDAAEFERPHRIRAILGRGVESTPHRRHYLAGRLEQGDEPDGVPEFVPARNQSSGHVGLFCGQDSFGIIPEDEAGLEGGASLEVERLSTLW